MHKQISIFSFFSGVGILDLAFEKNGYNIVYVNEFDPQFLDGYQYARQEMKISNPIYGYASCSAERYVKRRGRRHLLNLINLERKKGNWVGFIGGPPCPDFSVAGKNAGAKGENGRLTKTYFDIICKCKPDFFLFENVKGLVRTEKHRKFYNEMKLKVTANDYVISDSVENALAYGVPQFRERVFMVGIQTNFINEKQNKDMNGDGSLQFCWDQNKKFAIEHVLNCKWPAQTPFEVDNHCDFIYHALKELTVEYWFEKNQVETHFNCNDIFAVKKGRQKIATIPEGDTSGKSFKRLHRWRFSPTAAYGHNEVHLHPYKVRRISVSEAMAIQSLPKEFVLPTTLSLSKKFKTIGNGVPFLMAAAIAKTLRSILQSSQEDN